MKRSKSAFSFGSEQDLEKPTTSKGSAESMQTQYGDEFKFSEDHGKAKSLEHLEQEHSQPKDSSSATLNTTSPPTSSKASGVSIKRTIFVKKIRRSVSYFELIGLSSPELSRSSTKEDKRYEIEETKILPIPKTETGIKNSLQPSDKQLEDSQSTGTSLSITAEQKSYTEPVIVKQPAVEENKSSQQGTSSTSSPETRFDIYKNFFMRPSVIQKTTSLYASITGREEGRTSIEPEFSKSREAEGTKSSTEPKFVKSHEVEKIKIPTVPGFGKRPQAERTKISNEPEFVKRREIERTKSSTEPEFVKRYEIQRSKSSTEPVFVKSHEAERPKISTKPEFVKHREVEKSKSSTEPAFIKSHEAERPKSSTEPEFVKRYEIQRSKSSTEPVFVKSHETERPKSSTKPEFVKHHEVEKSKSSTETVFIKSHEAESPKSSTEPEFVKRYEIQRSKSSTEPVFVKSRKIERAKSFTEPGFIKRREFKDLKSYQQPSDRQSTGTHSTVSPGTSFDTQEKYYRRPSVIRKAEPSFTPRKSASFSGCTETTTSTEPEFVKSPEIAMPNEPVFLKRREIKGVKGSTESELIKRPEIEVRKSSTEPEPVKRRETKELKTSTEPELFKHNEIEVPTSSQQPTDKQYSRSSSKLSFDIFQSFIKNAPLFERLRSSIKFYKPDSSSSGEAGSSTKHEDLKRSDKETKSSQQPTSDKELIGAFSTSRPERDLKHSKSFEGSSYVTDEQRRSIAVYSPDSFSRSEDTKSSSDEDDIFAEVD